MVVVDAFVVGGDDGGGGWLLLRHPLLVELSAWLGLASSLTTVPYLTLPSRSKDDQREKKR